MIVGAAVLTSFGGQLLGLGLVVILLGAAVRLVLVPTVAVWRALGRPGQVILVLVGGLVTLAWLLDGGLTSPPRPVAPPNPPRIVTVAWPSPGVRP